MARDAIHVEASPQHVYDVLSEPRHYGEWVVGTQAVVESDPRFPASGSSFRYVAGVGPARITDRTIVLDAEPPSRLELVAKGGPLPDASITLELTPEGGGTRVTLHERPRRRILAIAIGPLGHFLISRRNQVALGRLKRIAESDRRAR